MRIRPWPNYRLGGSVELAPGTLLVVSGRVAIEIAQVDGIQPGIGQMPRVHPQAYANSLGSTDSESPQVNGWEN